MCSKVVKVVASEKVTNPALPLARFKQINNCAFSERSTSGFVLLDFEPEELAKQLTLMEFLIFQQIQLREYINSNWKGPEKTFLSPNICKISDLGNHIVRWLVSEILLVYDFDLRVATLEHIISTMKVI